ncbi:MAG TPA: hypothetical protein VGF33_09290 [Caulobacteraceae bacterium]|jgi:hypothetical protein
MSWILRRSALALIMASAALPSLAAPRTRPRDDDDDEERGIPNLFISPCGEPFRGASGAAYPVVDWFRQANKKGDGKLDHDEFVADADSFFKRLDINGDGALSPYEVRIYEKTMVPEILGGSVSVGMNDGARLWLAQYPGQQSPLAGVNQPIDPAGDHPDETAPPHPKALDESGNGAAPYSFFQEPEPIMAADFNVNGLILRDNFLKVADMHFTSLDANQKGYLTLAALPKTTVEKLLEKSHKISRRS